MNLMFKAFISSAPHERALRRARIRIERELNRRLARSGGRRTLDSAHMEHAFRKQIERYGDDALLRMGMILRGGGRGYVSDSDIRLLNMLPFAVHNKTPIGKDYLYSTQGERVKKFAPNHSLIQKIVRLNTKLENAQKRLEEHKQSLAKMMIPLDQRDYRSPMYLRWSSDSHINNLIAAYETMKDAKAGMNYNIQVLRRIKNNHPSFYNDERVSGYERIAAYRKSYIDARKILHDAAVETNHPEFQQNKKYFLHQFKIALSNASEDRTMKQDAIRKLNRIADLYSPQLISYVKKLTEHGRADDLANYSTTAFDTWNPTLITVYGDGPATVKEGDYEDQLGQAKIALRGMHGSYAQTKSGLSSSVIDWLRNFPVKKDKAVGGKYRYLYHATNSPSGFAIPDPRYFKTAGQNYGIGLYTNTIPYFARTGRMSYPLILKVPIPQHFKFLRHDKEYGKGKEGAELLANISNYFDALVNAMGRPNMKGIFHQSIQESLNNRPGVYYSYRDKEYVLPRYRTQLGIDETNDMYGHKLDKYRWDHMFEYPYEDAIHAYEGNGEFKEDHPAFGITLDKNLDGSRKIQLPGWALHRAIKYTFEKLGAPSSNELSKSTPRSLERRKGGKEIDYSKIMRDSSYHTSMLLSSLGYHGYMHFDPETAGCLKEIGPRHRYQFNSNTGADRVKKRLTEKHANNVKSCVLFPSSFSDIPVQTWGHNARGIAAQQGDRYQMYAGRSRRINSEPDTSYDMYEHPTRLPGLHPVLAEVQRPRRGRGKKLGRFAYVPRFQSAKPKAAQETPERIALREPPVPRRSSSW